MQMGESAFGIWHRGIAKAMTLRELEALRRGLRDDDGRLVQGSTYRPSLDEARPDALPVCGCAIVYAAWQGCDNPAEATIEQVDRRFVEIIHEAERIASAMNEARWFLTWFDYYMRRDVFAGLLREVEIAIAARDSESIGGA